MKQALLWMFLCLTLSGFLAAQTEGAKPAVSYDSTERMFFPRDTFWGYGQFDLAPPHNEIDPNICRADAGISGGVDSLCNAFARYMISYYVEAHRLSRQRFRNGSDPAHAVHPIRSAIPEPESGRSRAERAMGTLQHDWGEEIFRDEAVLRVC